MMNDEFYKALTTNYLQDFYHYFLLDLLTADYADFADFTLILR
jgi:hypothetical protein